MQLTRQQKEDLVDRLSEKMEETPVVGVLDMHSLPARQLQEIKKELVGEAEITMARKTLIELALEQADREGIEQLEENEAVQPALIFTEKNPFSLFQLIQQKKTSAAASGGETAPSDIVIEAGMTDLDPGPMLGEIQELGAGTSVEDGKIKVENDAVAVEAGDTIDNDTADVLNALGMEPLEVGLDLKLVYDSGKSETSLDRADSESPSRDGEVFDRDVLDIDTEAYRDDVAAAASQAFNLAVNAGYLTDATAETVVTTAAGNARNLAVNAGILAEDVVEDIVQKAAGEAAAVDMELDLEDVDIDDEGSDADDTGTDEDTDEADAEDDERGDEEVEDGEDTDGEEDDEEGDEQESGEDGADEATDEDAGGEEDVKEDGGSNDAQDGTDAGETDSNDETEVN